MSTNLHRDEAIALLRQISNARDRLSALADFRPPVTLADLCPDRCNFKDRAFEADVHRFMRDRMPGIDMDAFDTGDIEKWTRLDLDESERWELTEEERTPEPSEEGDGDEGDTFTVYVVTDTDTGETTEFDDESDAEDFIRECQQEDTHNLIGFPFAWGHGHLPDHVPTDLLSRAGFVVWQYEDERRSEVVAGIDGGGYSFAGAHFAPLYLMLAARHGWTVQTDTGPRRVSDEGL